MKISVIIVNYNVKYFLEVCLHATLRALEGIEGEVFVVDNNSHDGSIELVKAKFPSVILIENKENIGFGRANNQAVALAKGEYILFLNPDTVLPEDFFSKSVSYLDAHPEAGGLGPRLIDGKGKFAPDAKKSFPSLSVALFKGTGINKLFPKSPYFNKYYAVHIGEFETAEVDALSGCCMMMRKEAMKKAGGAFDEDYFMYFEDGDLCYRIRKAGFVNVYYPEVTVIHYKGESTKKTTLSYVKIFNEAFAIFAKKHYRKRYAQAFMVFINAGVVLRAILSAVKTFLKILKMPLFDAIVLALTLWFIKEFWTEQVKNILPIPWLSVYLTFPAYIFIWILSMFLNGAYDQPYRGVRVVRGMLIGTIICLAYFGLISSEFRYSRAIIILTGVIGSILLLSLHEVFYRLGIFKLVRYDALPRKAIIVGEEITFKKTSDKLKQVHYAPEIYGRVSPGENKEENALGNILHIKSLLFTGGIDEVIFCVNGLRYQEIIKQMQLCGAAYEYKIHLPDSLSFVGSNSSHTAGDLYTADRRFNLSKLSHQRNKRVIDIVISFSLLLFFPVAIIIMQNPMGYLRNCIDVLLSKKTWIGYSDALNTNLLPIIKPGILPPYRILENYEPDDAVKQQLNLTYATNYSASQDIGLLVRNFRFLGRKT
ncbi:MAG TPA: glycosyltransferase [Flavipsychrobacter sp.]|nr:glycosyltransferase [Flavipsychrobacter sp.]